MSRLNKYDSRNFKNATSELFENIEFMIGNNYMLVSLDNEIGPRYFEACHDLGKKPADVVQTFIEVKTPIYANRPLTSEQELDFEQRRKKFALLNPSENESLNLFDQKQLKKVSEDFIQNLEILFGEKYLLVRLEGDLKERFYKACERLGKNPYSIVQELISSRVIQYEEQVKQKKIAKEREERQASIDRFQQSISETKNMLITNEKQISNRKAHKDSTINLKEKL